MAEPTSATPRSNYFDAALAAAMGLFFIVTGARLLPLPRGPSNLHGPHWLVLCVGLAFFLAGITIAVQTAGHANAKTGDLPAEAPHWMAVVQYLIGYAIVCCLGAIASWVAFGPGERHFFGTFVFASPAVKCDYRAFGVGAVIIWLCTAAVVASAIRKFFDHRGKPTVG
jgi:hypothetical protein